MAVLNTGLAKVLASTTVWYGGRGVFAGGYAGVADAVTDSIEYITIASTGDASVFGDLDTARRPFAGMSNATRGVFASGTNTSSPETDYITIASTGNAQTFGSQTAMSNTSSGFGDGNRGLWAGSSSSGDYDTIEYITIDTTSSSTDFGNLLGYCRSQGGVSNAVRGVLFPGYIDHASAGYGSVTTYHNVIEYVTIATTGDATDFGDSTQDWSSETSCTVSNDTRGVRGGGSAAGFVDSIEYITVATTGNAIDFGDLTLNRSGVGGVSDGTTGVFISGDSYAERYREPTIDYITIATTGDATDFGDVIEARAFTGSVAGD